MYVLRSLVNGRFYIGQTKNIENRLFEHNSGQSKYTRSTRPFELVYTERLGTRSEAVAREKNFKSGQGRKWLSSFLSVRT